MTNTNRRLPALHTHDVDTSRVTHDDANGKRTAQTCACGARRILSQDPGSTFIDEGPGWFQPESQIAG